jgi:hypothetical protein
VVLIKCIFLTAYVEAEVLVFLAPSEVIVLLAFMSRLVIDSSERGMVNVKGLDTSYHAWRVFNSKYPDMQVDVSGEVKDCRAVSAFIGFVGMSAKFG